MAPINRANTGPVTHHSFETGGPATAGGMAGKGASAPTGAGGGGADGGGGRDVTRPVSLPRRRGRLASVRCGRDPGALVLAAALAPVTAPIESGGPADRRRVVVVAGHSGDALVVQAHLDDTDPSVRIAALGAAHRLGLLDADRLSASLSDPTPSVRIRAAELVAHLEGAGPAASVSLLGLLHDQDATVVEVAAWASGERVPPERGIVAELATLVTNAEDALVREAAVAALGSIGDPAGLAAILASLGDKATVRRRAVIALAPFDGPDVDAALQKATTDRDWQVRQAAEDLLAP